MSIHHLTAKVCSRLPDERGQGLTEYVMLVSVIAIAMIGSLISLKEIIHNVLANIPFLST